MKESEESRLLIHMDKVCLRKDARYVFSDLDLKIENPGIKLLMGRNSEEIPLFLELLFGLISPEKGEIRILGYKHRLFQKLRFQLMGYATVNFKLANRLTISENLNHLSRVRGVRKAEIAARIDSIVEGVCLEPLLNSCLNSLSFSEQMQVNLAIQLINKPEIVLIDQVLDGLKYPIRNHIFRYLESSSGTQTIILGTTDPHFVDDFRDVYLLKGGGLSYWQGKSLLNNFRGLTLENQYPLWFEQCDNSRDV